MRIGTWFAHFALVASVALGAVACGSRRLEATIARPRIANPSVQDPSVAAARTVTVDDLLSHAAEVTVTLHPPALVRDAVYGPLLQRASAMAAAYAGPRTVGTTALAAFERTDEVVVASNDATAEAVVVLHGVPGDLDAGRVVDEHGNAIWRPVVGDVSPRVVEYEPTIAADAALFVLPQRIWVIATGDAKAHTREALLGPISASSLAGEDATLAVLSIRGSALVRRDARLRDGALAPLGRALLRASFELTPGAEGVIDARFVYTDPAAAHASEQMARDVVAAFRRRLQNPNPPPLSWLAAAGVECSAATVTVRAPIPKAWLDALAHADAPAPRPTPTTTPTATATATATTTATRTPTPPDEIPWQLWHHPGSPTTPATPRAAQDSSQGGGSL
jgi:hypothetical protein